VTEPVLEVDDAARPRPAPVEGPPTTGFAPADLGSEAPTDERPAFEPTARAGSHPAHDPGEELELLADDDLATPAPEIDLVDTAPLPAEDEPATQGLFDAPGTDLSTLPDPDAPEKS
jgi:hypothetical protein